MPTKLTADRTQRICDSIVAGNSLAVAAKAGGIGARTLDRYLERGRAAESEVSAALDEQTAQFLDLLDTLDADARTAAIWELVGKSVPENERVYWHFLQDFDQARAAAEERAIGVIREAGYGYDATETRTVTKDHVRKDGTIVSLKTVTTITRYERDWRAEAWWLERVFPQKYGRADRAAVAGDGTTSPETVDSARQRAIAMARDEVAAKREQREESAKRQTETEEAAAE